ncbi:MAG: S8 family peptidase [Nanopusillaceae archaeon]
MVRNYLKSSDFVRAALPVIVQTNPQHTEEIGDFIRTNLDISTYKPILSEPGFYSFSILKRFNQITTVISGPDANELLQEPNIEAVYPDNLIFVKAFPIVPPEGVFYTPVGIQRHGTSRAKYMYFTSMEWVKRLIGADVANSKGYIGNGVSVAVVDTGGTYMNSMTAGKIIKQTVIPGVFTDANGHGEWCASAIAGRRAVDNVFTAINQKQVINEGVAPGVTLYSIKALGFVIGTGSNSMLLKGLHMALEDGVNIISCSWGGSASGLKMPEDSVFYSAYNTIVQAGIIPVQAAGNSGPNPNTIDDPGDLPNVLTVGSTNAVSNPSPFGPAGYVSDFSSRGPTNWGAIKPDVVAPTTITDSAITGMLSGAYTHVVHNMQALAGTSMSTPVVAGLIALMNDAFHKQTGRYLTLTDIFDMLTAIYGSKKTNDYGYGLMSWDVFEQWMQSQGYKV